MPESTAADESDPFAHALDRLPPDARTALRRAVLNAMGHPEAVPAEAAAELVNMDAQTVPLAEAQRELPMLVARTSSGAGRAPIVRIDGDDCFALLVSPDHVWRLVDRVDELEVALHVLANASLRGLDAHDQLQDLLNRLTA